MNHVMTAGLKLISFSLFLTLTTGPILAETIYKPTYVKPGISLAKYQKVMVIPLNMDDMEVLKPVWEKENPEVWTFEKGTDNAIQKIFMDSMRKELEAKGGYTFVSAPADDVLRIEVELLSITPYVKPGTKARDGYEIETLGSGDLVVSAELRDSRTRELLVLVEGERTIGKKYKKVSRQNHRENLNKLFTTWAGRIRGALNSDRSD
jgi:hypothetical protein